MQWITSCHLKLYDYTCNNTWAGTPYVIDNVRVNSTFSSLNSFSLKGDKVLLEGSYDKQNLTLMFILNGIYETRRRLDS